MSANNMILVREDKEGHYDVAEFDAETHSVNKKVGHFTTLREAMIRAEEFIKDSEFGVEYGVRFSEYRENTDGGA